MRAKYKHHPFIGALRVLMGWVFIVLGLLGLALPILQGVLFLAIGAMLLAPFIPFFRRIKIVLYRRFPKIRRLAEGGRRKLRAFTARFKPAATRT